MMDQREENYRGVFDSALGFGNSSAVIVIDFINAYTTEGSPLYTAAVVNAVEASVTLLDSARKHRFPSFTPKFYSKLTALMAVYLLRKYLC